ncbi:MAG TPA: zf-HC2 domain-containing protein [Terriglobia bacterium]
MFESCLEIRRQFSDYVDDACSDAARHSIRYHLRTCAACDLELERYQLLRADLRSLPRPRVSESDQLRLNVALSRALHANTFEILRVHFENALRPLLLPASGAVLAGLLCLGLTLDWLIVPPPMPDASSVTPAAVEALEPVDFNTGKDGLCLVGHVNADGRVVDYQVVSGKQSPELKSHLDHLMYFSVFRPATRLGKPTDGQVILSLRRITVRAWETPPRDENGKSPASSSDLAPESAERARV